MTHDATCLLQMGEANEARSRGMEKLPLQTEKYPTDLLQRFLYSNTHQAQSAALNEEDDDSEEIELNLGLSLGGRFGVDKNAKKLIRSSSTASTIPVSRDDETSTPPAVSYPALIRTSSLPTETEEEWRKRKELQTLRRMEAKRRRSEKQRNKDGNGMGIGGCLEEERRELEGPTELNLREKRPCLAAAAGSRLSSTVAPTFGLPSWAAAARQALIGGIVDEVAKGKGCTSGGSGGLQGVGHPASQCSAESQGGSSSGTSELDSKHIQGSSSYGEARSSSQERGNLEAAGSLGSKISENPSGGSLVEAKNSAKKLDSAENRGREIGTTSMEDMPCVFTIGDGPDGRRVEGILYKYGKGEEVRIMCVCHGKFLSPAEFVRHAGGKDVAHPLRHIVVNPNSGPFL